MRRFILAVPATLAFGLAACNDGPNQTYKPPPANAGWNNGWQGDGGLPSGIATGATAPFTNGDGGAVTTGGNNANEICTPQQVAARNPILNTAPIILPNRAGGLNIAGDDGNGGTSWKGLTIEDAEQINCQGTAQPDIFGSANYLTVFWNGGSVVAEYYVPTHKVDYIGIGIFGQYQGKMVVTGRPDTNGSVTTYTIAIDGQTQIDAATKDSAGNTTHSIPTLDWFNAQQGVPAAVKPFDDIYRAAMATFMPGFPPESATQTCNQTGSCIIGTFPGGYGAYMFVPALGWAMWAGYYLTPSTANAINRMDIQFAQIMNFSPANPILKLDSPGPTAVPLKFAGGQTCALKLGMTYGDFFNNCVATASDPTANTTEALELFSNLSHDEETIQFNIAGVDESFSGVRRLGPTQVLIDQPAGGCVATPDAPGCPQPTDVSFELNVDQSTLGLVANDWQYDSNGNPTIHDLAGAGALYNDYRTLSISALLQETGLVGKGISGCIGARDAQGNLTSAAQNAALAYVGAAGLVGQLPVGCTGMEPLLSADISQTSTGPNYDDPVNIGPIVTQITSQVTGASGGNYTLGMKMGHQVGLWCYDAMSINQIAAQSSLEEPSTGPDGGTVMTSRALTGDEVVEIGEVGTNGFLTSINAAPGATVNLTLPQYCISGNLLPQSNILVAAALANGNEAGLPIDVQGGTQGTPSARFFFKEYGLALIQTLEASTGTAARPNGGLTMPVANWGPADVGSAMPVQLNDLYFDSNGDGQFESMEYVDRRFVCPDGANDCAPPGATNFACPTYACVVGQTAGCIPNAGQPVVINGVSTLTCNPSEVAQPPTDIVFVADVKDGIMNSYDFNRYLYRGETALYASIQKPGHALAQASNALFSNIFGSPLLNAYGASVLYNYDSATGKYDLPAYDLTGNYIDPSAYADALNYAYTGQGTALTLSYQQQPSAGFQLTQTFWGMQQAQLTSPNFQEMVVWTPRQPGNGFDEAIYGNSMLDAFVQTASVDFTGITTSALVDYNVFLPSGAADNNPNDYGPKLGIESEAVESTNYLGDVFMCYEPNASPPLLAVRMYTPTAAVLNWINANPQSYTDCGLVVRWSPFDNFPDLIESTTFGIRLDVTQGGGLGRVVGVQEYVPGLAVEQ